MGKPTEYPEWATGVSADIVEPSAGKKELGWVAGEEPPAQYFNWLLKALADKVNAAAFGYSFGWTHETYRWPTIASDTGPAAITPLLDHIGYYLADADAVLSVTGPYIYAGFGIVPTLQLILSAEATSCASVMSMGSTVFRCVGAFDDSIAIMEWQANISTVGANGVAIHMGLHSYPLENSADYYDGSEYAFAMFQKLTGETTWHAVAADGGSATSADTGVTPVANTWERFRLEYHGLNTPVGVAAGQPVVRFYIADALEATLADAYVPRSADNGGNGYALGVSFRIQGGTSAERQLRIGTVHLAFNDYAVSEMPT